MHAKQVLYLQTMPPAMPYFRFRANFVPGHFSFLLGSSLSKAMVCMCIEQYRWGLAQLGIVTWCDLFAGLLWWP